MCLCLDRMRPFLHVVEETATPGRFTTGSGAWQLPFIAGFLELNPDPPLSRLCSGWSRLEMLVNDGHWPATLVIIWLTKEPAIGFHQGLKPLCSSPYYLTSKAVNSMIKCAYKSEGWIYLPSRSFSSLFSLSLSSLSFFFVKYIQMTFLQGQEVPLRWKKSELLSPVVLEFQTAQHESECSAS